MKTAEEEHQQLVCDFEQVKFKLTSRDEEFSEFKAMHDERVRTIEDEKTELLVARDQLKVSSMKVINVKIKVFYLTFA